MRKTKNVPIEVTGTGKMIITEKGVESIIVNGKTVDATDNVAIEEAAKGADFDLKGLIAAAQQGPKALSEWMDVNGPKPCPATVAITRFAHEQMLHHFSQMLEIALNHDEAREALGLAIAARTIEDSLQRMEEIIPHFEDVPELTYGYMHALLSLANPAYVCDSQAAGNAKANFDNVAASAMIEHLLQQQPGKEATSQPVFSMDPVA